MLPSLWQRPTARDASPLLTLRLALGAVALAASISCARDATPPAELAIAWNKQILTIAEAEDGFLTLKGVRAAAMMHLAMHDALNAIEPRHHRYTSGPPAEDAHPIVAAAQAAHEVAVDQYPDHAAALAELRDRWTTAVPDGDARRRALELGTSTARAILDRRADDGWDATSAYTWHPMGPGVYAAFHEHSGTPEGFVFGAGWSVARPFALPAPDHFRAPPPPAIHDDAYTKAFQEVKEVGAAHSQTRTPDQTHLAMWWKEFVESSHNRLARDLATRESLSLSDTVRLLALLNLAIYDAYVCVFDNKFAYNHWRPYTAIREAAHDGNPDTTPDPDWTNLHDHTYAFPSYPSAHGCASAAAMTILADTFGDETAFTMRIPEVDRAGPMSGKVPMDPPTRSFTRFSEASLECAMSRVYLGIHFRYDSVAGVELGSRIGRHVVEGFLTRVGP